MAKAADAILKHSPKSKFSITRALASQISTISWWNAICHPWRGICTAKSPPAWISSRERNAAAHACARRWGVFSWKRYTIKWHTYPRQFFCFNYREFLHLCQSSSIQTETMPTIWEKCKGKRKRECVQTLTISGDARGRRWVTQSSHCLSRTIRVASFSNRVTHTFNLSTSVFNESFTYELKKFPLLAHNTFQYDITHRSLYGLDHSSISQQRYNLNINNNLIDTILL